MFLLSVNFNLLVEILLKLTNLFHSLLDPVKFFLFFILQSLELVVEITLKLKDDLLNECDLNTLALVSVQFKGFIEEVVDVGATLFDIGLSWSVVALQSLLELFQVFFKVDDFPVH